MKNKVQALLMVFVLMASLLGNTLSNVGQVNASADYGDQFITSAGLLDENGNPATDVDQYATTQAHYEFEIPDGQVINAGDTMTVKLPSQLVITGNPNFDIKDAQGNVIGHAVVNKATGEVVITFTDFYETHPNNKKGSFNIWTAWDNDQISVDTDVPLDWGSQGTTTVHVGSDEGPATDEQLYKWGSVDANDPTLIHWTARVNFKKEAIKNAVLTDTIGANQTLVSGSIVAKYVAYDATGSNYSVIGDVAASAVNEISEQSFEINFGDLNDTVLVNYDTRATDNGASDTYTNGVTLTGDNIETSVVDVHTPSTGGSGSGSGDNQSVILTKSDVDNSQTVLAGAHFKLVDANGQIVKADVVTDSTGKLQVTGLATGQYQFIETQAPTGYQLDETPVPFEIVANQDSAVSVVKTDKQLLGSVILTKQDNQDGSTLQGAVFELKDSHGKVLQSGLTTDASGQIAVKDLEPGDYTFVETQAPNGYELDKTPVKFTITKGQTSAVKVIKTDKLIPGSVILTKQDNQDGSTLQGAVFELKDSHGKVLQSGLTTDASGQIAVKDLEPGDYTFVETKAPTGYELDKTPVEFTITKGQTSAVKVIKTDKLIPGSVILTKQDNQDGSTLQGAVFELKDSHGKVLQSGLTTDASGQIAVKDLEPGDYTFVETKAPAGYELDKTPVKFTITKGQTSAVKVIKTDKLIPGSVILSKQDNQDGSTLQGAVFELKDSHGKVLQSGLTTDASGQIAVKDLEPGDYTFVETKAPTGYELDKTPVKFTITKGQTSAVKVIKTDKLIPGSVILTKQDNQDGSTLQGAVFELKDSHGKVLQSGLTTDASGQIAVKDLEPGDYTFVETKAPTGYELDKTPVKFTITKGQTSAVKVIKTDKLIPGSVILSKQDNQDGSTLQGAVFELKDSHGKVLQSGLTTDASGQIAVKDLEPGDYTFVETKAPTGYELDKTPVEFTITKGQTSAVKVIKTDKLIPGSVILTKQDDQTGTALAGATFKILDSQHKVIKENLKSNQNGQIVVTDLVPGNYSFVETKAPTGYILDETPVKFTVKSEKQAVQVTKENQQEKHQVRLEKRDTTTNQLLAGAVFKLVDQNGMTRQTNLITGQDGVILLKDLPVGQYQLVETKAPTGYQLDKTPLNFMVNQKQTSLTLVKYNTKLAEKAHHEGNKLPQTGVDNNRLFGIIGLLLVLLGSVGYWQINRKRKA